MASDRHITWIKTKNTVEERLIESSFIHRLVPRKINKKRKMLNILFKKNSSLTSYSQYVKKIRSALQYFSGDSQTEDDMFSDCDYSQLCQSNSSFHDRTAHDIKEDTDVLLSEESITREESEITIKNTSDVEEEEDDHTSTIIDCKNITQNNILKTEPSCSNDDTCISVSSLDLNEILKDYNSPLKSEKRQWHSLNDQPSQEVPLNKKVKLSDSTEKNLVPELKSETLDIPKYNTKHVDIDGNISSDSCNMWNGSSHIARETTPVHEKTTHKDHKKLHESLSKKGLKNYPQDSGIDDDSQEDSSRDGKHNVKKLTNQLDESKKISSNVKTDTLHRNVKGTVEKEARKSHTKRKSTITSECLENTNENSVQTCRSDSKSEKGDTKRIQKSAKLNLNRIFENESVTNQLDTRGSISSDFKSTECDEENEITEKLAKNRNKELNHDKIKISPVRSNVLESTKSNNYNTKHNNKILDAENASEKTIYNNDKIQMEDPSFAGSENSESTKVTGMTFKSIKDDNITIEHSKKNNMISDNNLSEHTTSETACDSDMENRRQKNNDEIRKGTAEGTQKQKLAPKVMCTEVVNTKYKIIFKDKCNVRSNAEKILDSSVNSVNESIITSCYEKYHLSDKENSLDMKIGSQTKSKVTEALANFGYQNEIGGNVDEDINKTKEENEQAIEKEEHEESNNFEDLDSINNLHSQIDVTEKEEKSRNVFEKSDDDEQEFKRVTNIVGASSGSLLANEFLKREEDEEDEDSDNNGNDAVSPRTIRRLHQLERLNLTASSDSSSEDEVELKNTVPKDTLVTKNYSQEKQKTVMTQKMNTDTKEKRHFGKTINQNSSRLQCTKHNGNEERKTNAVDSLRHEQQSIYQENVEDDIDTMDNESTEEEFDTVGNREINRQQKRPTTLEELVIQENLIKNKTPASFNMKNIEDDEEVYILSIPSALNIQKLKGKKMLLKENKLKLDDEMYKVKCKSLGSVTCVFHKGKKHASYKVVNTRPIGSITTRYKYFDLPDLLNTEESTEDDAVVTNNSLKEEKRITKKRTKIHKKTVPL